MKFNNEKQEFNLSPIGVGRNNISRMTMVKAGVDTLFEPGQIVHVTKDGIEGEWDGTDIAAGTLAIVESKRQVKTEKYVKLLRFGSYKADRVTATTHKTPITAVQRFTLTLFGLFDEGGW